MNKKDAISKIKQLIKEISKVKATEILGASFSKWRRDTNVALSHIFQQDPHTAKEFRAIVDQIEYIMKSTESDNKDFEYTTALEKAEVFLESCIREIDEYWPNDGEVKNKNNETPDTKKVFVVHGRDSRLRDDFFAFLRALGLNPIEWSEALRLTKKATPYIGEAIESAFNSAQAVIVLLSPDDEVRLSAQLWRDKEEESEKQIMLQARPNVLFEAGMAFGTHHDRTLLIEVGRVKAFSDVAGRHVVKLTNTPESRNDVANRLRTAGCGVSQIGNDWLKAGDFTVNRDKYESIGYAQTDLSEKDIIALLYAWWPRPKTGESFPDDVKVNFSEVDQLLSLPPGSTKKYIPQVAFKKGFKPISTGNVIATFEYDINSEDFGTYSD
jgi:predicted nucleotide-binding protein